MAKPRASPSAGLRWFASVFTPDAQMGMVGRPVFSLKTWRQNSLALHKPAPPQQTTRTVVLGELSSSGIPVLSPLE